MVVDRVHVGVCFLDLAELREEALMELAKMTEEELRLFKKETLRRLSRIAQADGHPLVAYVMADGCAELVDLETGKPIFCTGKEIYET